MDQDRGLNGSQPVAGRDYIPSQHALISSCSLTIPFLFYALSLSLSLSLSLFLSLSLSLSFSLSLAIITTYPHFGLPLLSFTTFCYVFKSLNKYVWKFALFTRCSRGFLDAGGSRLESDNREQNLFCGEAQSHCILKDGHTGTNELFHSAYNMGSSSSMPTFRPLRLALSNISVLLCYCQEVKVGAH